MRVAICDDEKLFRDTIKVALYGYSNLHRMEVAIEEFSCGVDLLETEHKFEIIFYNYKIDGIDGLEIARLMSKKSVGATMFLITSFPKHVYEAYEVFGFRFFETPLDVAQLYKAMDECFESIHF